MKNWKTTLAALLAAIPQIMALWPDFIPTRIANSISIVLVVIGLCFAKDYNVTGNPAKTIGEDVPDKTKSNVEAPTP